VIATVPRLLPGDTESLTAYQKQGGYRALDQARRDLDTLRDVLARTGLTGLGGAHFPFATKLSLTFAAPGPRAVVCNAAEDEPGSQKDRTLLERNPHLVIEGTLIAAAALQADVAYFYVSETLDAAWHSLQRALQELADDPLLAAGVELHLHRAPVAYVAGEATAAVRSIDGGEAKPMQQPPYPSESGVAGRPTLVSNCETLANLPRLFAAGNNGETTAQTWSRLVTITGDIDAPGVYEISPDETTFADLIAMAGGITGTSPQLKAIQPGGPSSAYLPASAADVLLRNEDIREAGSQPGCLAVRVLSQARCLVEDVTEVTGFFAREQCGQCPSCRMKTQAYSKLIQQVQKGRGTWDVLTQLSAVDEFVADMPSRCALISMPTPPVTSALRLFREDFAAHIERSTDAPGCAAAH
jgi:NADH-quinone oxidoreductase subunit F